MSEKGLGLEPNFMYREGYGFIWAMDFKNRNVGAAIGNLVMKGVVREYGDLALMSEAELCEQLRFSDEEVRDVARTLEKRGLLLAPELDPNQVSGVVAEAEDLLVQAGSVSPEIMRLLLYARDEGVDFLN